MTDQMPRAQIRTQTALLANGLCYRKHGAFILHPPLNQRMRLRQNQQAPVVLLTGVSSEVIRPPIIGPPLIKPIVNGCTPASARTSRKDIPIGTVSVIGLATAPLTVRGTTRNGVLLLNCSGDVEHGLDVIDHHADADRQRGRRNSPTCCHPDGQNLVTCRVDIGQNM